MASRKNQIPAEAVAVEMVDGAPAPTGWPQGHVLVNEYAEVDGVPVKLRSYFKPADGQR